MIIKSILDFFLHLTSVPHMKNRGQPLDCDALLPPSGDKSVKVKGCPRSVHKRNIIFQLAWR